MRELGASGPHGPVSLATDVQACDRLGLSSCAAGKTKGGHTLDWLLQIGTWASLPADRSSRLGRFGISGARFGGSGRAVLRASEVVPKRTSVTRFAASPVF